MLVKSVVNLMVLDKVAKEYDFVQKDVNGNEVHNSGISYYACVKPEGDIVQNIKLPSRDEELFNSITVGQENSFIFEFETTPKAFVKDGKAQINFNHIPKIVGIVPFNKK